MRRRTRLAPLPLEDRTAPAGFANLFDAQHLDLRVDFAAGNWNTQLIDVAAGRESAASDALIFAGAAAKVTPPPGNEFAFLGATDTLYQLSQASDSPRTRVGFSAERTNPPDLGAYTADDPRAASVATPWIKVKMLAVNGPGAVSAYEQLPSGAPKVWMASADGITAGDVLYVAASSHQDLTWAFSAPGIYTVDVQPSAFLGADRTNPVTGPTVRLTFSVDPPAPTATAPAAVASDFGAAIAFTGATGFTVAAAPIGPSPLAMTLTVAHGTLTTTNTVAPAATLTLTGSPQTLAAALSSLKYQPTSAYNGADTLTVVTSDQGFYRPATEAAGTDTDVVAITVTNNPNTPGKGTPGVPLVVPGVPPPPPTDSTATRFVAVGRDAGAGPQVAVFNPDGTLRYTFDAYEGNFAGGVRTAVGDVTGDGVAEIIVAPGPGRPPYVRVFDAVTSAVLAEFAPVELTFTGGLYVAAGDIDGNFVADIIIGTGAGGGPRVQAFRGGDYALMRNFFPYEDSFRGGVLVSAGDVTGDGIADIITGTGVGGGPRVQIFDGPTGATKFNFFAYEPSFRGGVFAAAGDVTGDGAGDIITGTGAGGGPAVRVFTTAAIVLAQSPAPAASFFAFDGGFRGGVRVDALDTGTDGTAEIFASPGAGGGAVVKVFALGPLRDVTTLTPFPGDELATGAFVGAG